MNRALRVIGIISGIMAFVFCLVGGIVILSYTSLKKEEAVWIGLGLYFVGKAFFVGPLLVITTLRAGDKF